METKTKVKLTQEQKDFLINNQEMLRSIPFRWFARTSNQNWGVGDTLKEALQNAYVAFKTRWVAVSVVSPEWEINEIDGGLSDLLGFHDKGQDFSPRDFASPEVVLELAMQILEHFDKTELSWEIQKVIMKWEDKHDEPFPMWNELKDKRGKSIL